MNKLNKDCVCVCDDGDGTCPEYFGSSRHIGSGNKLTDGTCMIHPFLLYLFLALGPSIARPKKIQIFH
jgi:hypothetical protein